MAFSWVRESAVFVIMYTTGSQLTEEYCFTKPDASLSRVERSLWVLAEEEIAQCASAFLKKGLG